MVLLSLLLLLVGMLLLLLVGIVAMLVLLCGRLLVAKLSQRKHDVVGHLGVVQVLIGWRWRRLLVGSMKGLSGLHMLALLALLLLLLLMNLLHAILLVLLLKLEKRQLLGGMNGHSNCACRCYSLYL